jgi:hypothetical protein
MLAVDLEFDEALTFEPQVPFQAALPVLRQVKLPARRSATALAPAEPACAADRFTATMSGVNISCVNGHAAERWPMPVVALHAVPPITDGGIPMMGSALVHRPGRMWPSSCKPTAARSSGDRWSIGLIVICRRPAYPSAPAGIAMRHSTVTLSAGQRLDQSRVATNVLLLDE